MDTSETLIWNALSLRQPSADDHYLVYGLCKGRLKQWICPWQADKFRTGKFDEITHYRPIPNGGYYPFPTYKPIRYLEHIVKLQNGSRMILTWKRLAGFEDYSSPVPRSSVIAFSELPRDPKY